MNEVASYLSSLAGVPLTRAETWIAEAGTLAAVMTDPPASCPPAARRRIRAAYHLATTLEQDQTSQQRLDHPAAVARYLTLRYTQLDQEVMGALYLNTRHHLITDEQLFRGTISRAAVEPRAILRRALQLGAPAFILFHTHPSGDPSPSAEDLAFTRRLREAGEVVGVRLVDHLILGALGRFLSLCERGSL